MTVHSTYIQYAVKFVGSMSGPMWIYNDSSASHNFKEALRFGSVAEVLDFIKVSKFERKDCRIFELRTTAEQID